MPSTPTIGVLALQGDVREHLAALESCGARSVPVRRLSELDTVDGLIIPGGESTTMSRLLVVFDLLEPLRARLKEGMPAYGSCAGMILLASEVLDTRPDAEHLDGIDITVRRNAFGRQVDSFEADLEFKGIAGDPVPAGPAAGHIVAVRQGAVLATSFHPEVTGDRRVHRLFTDLVRTA